MLAHHIFLYSALFLLAVAFIGDFLTHDPGLLGQGVWPWRIARTVRLIALLAACFFWIGAVWLILVGIFS